MKYLRVLLALSYAIGALLVWMMLEQVAWFHESRMNKWGFIGLIILGYFLLFEYLMPRNGKRK